MWLEIRWLSVAALEFFLVATRPMQVREKTLWQGKDEALTGPAHLYWSLLADVQ